MLHYVDEKFVEGITITVCYTIENDCVLSGI